MKIIDELNQSPLVQFLQFHHPLNAAMGGYGMPVDAVRKFHEYAAAGVGVGSFISNKR